MRLELYRTRLLIKEHKSCDGWKAWHSTHWYIHWVMYHIHWTLEVWKSFNLLPSNQVLTNMKSTRCYIQQSCNLTSQLCYLTFEWQLAWHLGDMPESIEALDECSCRESYWRKVLKLIGGLSGEMPACFHRAAQTALSHVWDPILQASQIFPTFSTIKSFVCPKYPTAVWKCKKSTKPRKWLAAAKWLAIVGFSRHFGLEKASGCGSAPNVA